MKKIIIYSLLLGATFLSPLQGEDVGKLLPVELIQIYKEADSVVIATDDGAGGTGATVRDAIGNLKATTAGVIFLDTADYLLVDETAAEEVTVLTEYLKPSVRVCASVGEIDLKEAAAFLKVHRPQIKLSAYDGGQNTEVLTVENGRLILKES